MLLSGCQRNPPAGTEPPPEQRYVPSPHAVDRGQEVDPSVVDQYARKHFPDQYAGVAVESPVRIVVYRVPSPRFDEALRREFSDVVLVLRDARYSQRELQSLTERIVGETEYWRAQGVDIHGVGPDFVRGVVEVVTSDAETARRLFAARYGDRVAIREGDEAVPATG